MPDLQPVTTTTAAPPPPAAASSAPPAATTTLAAPPATTQTTGTPAQAGQDGQAPGTTQQPQGTTAAPADVELKLPEGWKADETLMGEFKLLAKESGLKSESAQKVFDLYVKGMTAQQKALESTREQQDKEWTEAAKADAEIGGKDFDKNLESAKRALTKFGGPDLVKFLEGTRLGNFPPLVRAFVRIGKAMSEDSMAHSTTQPGGAVTEEERLRVMFPSMFPNP